MPSRHAAEAAASENSTAAVRSFALRFLAWALVTAGLMAWSRAYESELTPLLRFLALAAWALHSAVGGSLQLKDQMVFGHGVQPVEVGGLCSGLDVIFLVVGAVLATRFPWPKRLLGIACMVVGVIVLNVFRLAWLFHLSEERSPHFHDFHSHGGALLLILGGTALFLVWARRTR